MPNTPGRYWKTSPGQLPKIEHCFQASPLLTTRGEYRNFQETRGRKPRPDEVPAFFAERRRRGVFRRDQKLTLKNPWPCRGVLAWHVPFWPEPVGLISPNWPLPSLTLLFNPCPMPQICIRLRRL